jgi:hypothetical protein
LGSADAPTPGSSSTAAGTIISCCICCRLHGCSRHFLLKPIL